MVGSKTPPRSASTFCLPRFDQTVFDRETFFYSFLTPAEYKKRLKNDHPRTGNSSQRVKNMANRKRGARQL